MPQSEELKDGSRCIPVEQHTEGSATISQTHTQKLNRSSLRSLPDTLPLQPDTIDQSQPSKIESSNWTSTELNKKAVEQEHNQQDQDNRSDESSSTPEKGDDMLSFGSLSGSSSTSLTMPTGDVPALPAKSSLRASRLLASIPQKKIPGDDQPMLPHAAPHQVYLSSEEDASSSADDFSDFDDEVESDSGASQKTTVRIISREDTARMVAVIFHGKPSIVTLSPRRSISPSASEVGQEGAGLLRTTTEPCLQRPRSVSSTSSSITPFTRPPRSSSMMSAFDKKRPHFLHIDPYAKAKNEQPEPTKTPNTPTAMIRRTLSLVKKRSKQSLHQSESQLTPMEKVGEVAEEDDPRESISMEPNSPGPVSYQDIMKKAQRNAAASRLRNEVSSPMSPRNRLRAGLSLSRQRSVRA